MLMGKENSNPHHWGHNLTKKIPHIVHDVSGREEEFSLEKEGFMWMKHESKLKGEELRDYERVRG